VSPAITMTGAITALAAGKRATGYKYDTEERVLARFAAFSGSQFPGLEAPTRASVEAWITSARERGVKPATLQGLAAPVRELARWLGRRGVPAYVLPTGALPRPARYVPHIYTDQELAAQSRCTYAAGNTELGLALVHPRVGIRSSGFPADAEVGRPEREAAGKHEAQADGGDTYQRPDLRRRRGG